MIFAAPIQFCQSLWVRTPPRIILQLFAHKRKALTIMAELLCGARVIGVFGPISSLAATPCLRDNCRLADEAVSFFGWALPLSHLPPIITASPADRKCKDPGRTVVLCGASRVSCRQSRTHHCAVSAAGPPAAVPCAVNDWPDAAPSTGGNRLHLFALDQFRLGDLCRGIWGACVERACLSGAEEVASSA